MLQGVIDSVMSMLGMGNCAHPECSGKSSGPVTVHEQNVARINEENPDEHIGKNAANDTLVFRIPMKGQRAVPEEGVKKPGSWHTHHRNMDEPPTRGWADGIGGFSVMIVHDVGRVDDHNNPGDDIMESALKLAKEKRPQRLQQLIGSEDMPYVLGCVPDRAVTGPELEQIEELQDSLQHPIILHLALGSSEVGQTMVSLVTQNIVERGPYTQHKGDGGKEPVRVEARPDIVKRCHCNN